MLGTYALSAGYYDAYYVKAQQIRRLIKNDFMAAFNDVDLCLRAAVRREGRFVVEPASRVNLRPDPDPEQRRCDHACVERARRAEPERDDRLAERDDDEEPVPLREVRRRHAEAGRAEREDAAHVDARLQRESHDPAHGDLRARR